MHMGFQSAAEHAAAQTRNELGTHGTHDVGKFAATPWWVQSQA